MGRGRSPNGQHKPYLTAQGVWVYRVDTGRITAQGTRERLTVSSRDPRVAKAKYKALMRRLNAGDVPQAGSQGMTVKAWSETWLPIHQEKVRPKTYDTDAGAVRKWVVPTIGHRRLAELSPADVREVRRAILRAGRSSTTALHAHRVLMKMLRDAIDEGRGVTIPQAVFSKSLTPGKAANDRAAIPVDQAWSLLEVIGKRDDSSRWLLGILYGLRQGEVLGLDWDHVDLDAPSIHVEWQLQRLPANPVLPDGFRAKHLTGPMWQTETKTASGRRALPLVSLMAASLAASKEAWTPNPWGLVWAHDGKPIRAEHDRATWKRIQAQAEVAHPSGRAWHVHECRHTVATLLMRQGTPLAVSEKILGQSKLVQSYLHADSADALAALEGVLSQLTAPDEA